MTDRRCRTCLFWARITEDGECRRHAPVPATGARQAPIRRRWPLTLADEWCGMWAPHPINQQGEDAALVERLRERVRELEGKA